METLLKESKTQRDNYYMLYKSWQFTVDILDILNKGINSPVGLTPPFNNDQIIMAIPVSSGVINLPESNLSIPLIIEPNPIDIARNMNLTLSDAIRITITMYGKGKFESDYIAEWDVLCENDRLANICNENEDGYDIVSSNMVIPKSILEVIKQQITPDKLDEDLKEYGEFRPRVGFNFEWDVYLVIPPDNCKH